MHACSHAYKTYIQTTAQAVIMMGDDVMAPRTGDSLGSFAITDFQREHTYGLILFQLFFHPTWRVTGARMQSNDDHVCDTFGGGRGWEERKGLSGVSACTRMYSKRGTQITWLFLSLVPLLVFSSDTGPRRLVDGRRMLSFFLFTFAVLTAATFILRFLLVACAVYHTPRG